MNQKNMKNSLSKKQIKEGWKIVKFGEIAKNISERVDPLTTNLKVYVGLEHLDSQSLRITRQGVPADVKGQKLRVRPGQIIFGKRRAYQKKLAVADFDGICSAHAMVLEAVPGKIIPELLPFFMQSDMFMDRAVDISEGSLSPTIKWKILAIQKFPLPPFERQKKNLEILKKIEETLNNSQERLLSLNELKKQTARLLLLRGLSFNQLFGEKSYRLPTGWKKVPLGMVIERIQYGLSEAVQKTGQYPILRMMNMERGYVVPNDLKYINLDSKIFNKFLLQKNDILFNRTNSMDWVGRTGLFMQEGDYVFASYLLRVNIKPDKVTAFYVNQYLNLPVVQYRLKAYATPGVSQANINPNSLRQLPFLLPSIKHIEMADAQLNTLDKSITEHIKHHQAILKITGKLCNAILFSEKMSNEK